MSFNKLIILQILIIAAMIAAVMIDNNAVIIGTGFQAVIIALYHK